MAITLLDEHGARMRMVAEGDLARAFVKATVLRSRRPLPPLELVRVQVLPRLGYDFLVRFKTHKSLGMSPDGCCIRILTASDNGGAHPSDSGCICIRAQFPVEMKVATEHHDLNLDGPVLECTLKGNLHGLALDWSLYLASGQKSLRAHELPWMIACEISRPRDGLTRAPWPDTTTPWQREVLAFIEAHYDDYSDHASLKLCTRGDGPTYALDVNASALQFYMALPSWKQLSNKLTHQFFKTSLAKYFALETPLAGQERPPFDPPIELYTFGGKRRVYRQDHAHDTPAGVVSQGTVAKYLKVNNLTAIPAVPVKDEGIPAIPARMALRPFPRRCVSASGRVK